MAKLGSQNNPLILNVQSSYLAEEIAAICIQRDWYFVIEHNVTKPDDISDFEKKMNPPTLEYGSPKLERNAACPCGSGKKYKKCCVNADFTSPDLVP